MARKQPEDEGVKMYLQSDVMEDPFKREVIKILAAMTMRLGRIEKRLHEVKKIARGKS